MQTAPPAQTSGSAKIRWPLALLALFFASAGVLHFVAPAPYERIVPAWLPNAPLLVAVSGAAELAGAIGLLLARWRRPAAWGLITLLVAVFPANVQMLNLAIAAHATPATRAALWFRLPLQGLIIWWVWISAIRRRHAVV